MGRLKTIERKGKRMLIRLATSVVHTEPVPKETLLGNPPRRILVIRQHNQMGDMLLAVPAFRALTETFPNADIDVLTGRINRDVLLNNPYVNRVHTFAGPNPFRTALLLRRLRRTGYDIVIVLHTVSFSFTSAVLGLLSGARYRVGSTSRPFRNPLSRSFYHFELPLPDPASLEGMNEAEHNLYPLRALGVGTSDIRPLLVPTAENGRFAAAFFEAHAVAGRPTITVHPGAGKAGNIWPPERFAEVIRRLAGERAVNVFVVEGPRDAVPVSTFCRCVGRECAVLRGRPIGDVAAVLEQSDLVVCNDTGIMHVAGAAGARTLAVFGPTDPVRWAPRCPNVHVVRSADGRLDSLDENDVYEKARELLALGEAGRPVSTSDST